MASKRVNPTQTDGGRQPRRKLGRAAITGRAYQRYQAERGGDPDRDWLQAERERQGG